MTRFRLSALAVAGLLACAAGSASAADLGGNCCADLEERIAELEATTARKGNRKVSLTVSGWVAEQIVWWDDGTESNVYVGGIGTTLASHVKFTGQAQISTGWSAGYVLQIEAISNEPLAWNQDSASGNTRTTDVLQSFWFLKSDTYGKLSVGLQSQASDNTAILVDGSGSLVPANWVIFDGAGFFLRSNGADVVDINGGNITWGGGLGVCHHISAGIAADCNGVPLNAVRYDSPTWGGFSVSASWGEDDFWDVAARYAGEHAGFKLAAATAYSENTDENVFGGIPKRDSQYFQIGAYVQHIPTGLFVYGAYGNENNDFTLFAVDGVAIGDAPDSDHWYIKAGIRRNWHPLGATVLYGEYGQHNDMYGGDLLDQATNEVGNGLSTADSEFRRWGIGIVQEIDAAAMSVWLKYRRHEGEISGRNPTPGNNLNIDMDDIDFLGVGALINF